MTVVAVLLDPPRDGLVLPALPDESPLPTAQATDLYRAMAGDVLRAVESSGGDLLVNYRPEELLPDAHRAGGEDATAEAEVRALAADALADPSAARFEVQVGSTPSARVGNTVAHLLREEGATSAAVVAPDAPALARTHVDSAAMKLRRRDVVLGPSPGGRVYYAGFAEPVDFEDACAPPALETLTDRAVDAGLDVDFLAQVTRVRTGADLASLVAELRARRRTGRNVPARTTAFVEEHGLRADDDGDGLRPVRDG